MYSPAFLVVLRTISFATVVFVLWLVGKNEGPSIKRALLSWTGDWEPVYSKTVLESLPPQVTVPNSTTPPPPLATRIRTFSSHLEEMFFIYQKHLLSHWTPRPDRVRKFRREIFKASNWTQVDQLVLTTQNVRLKASPIPFYSQNIPLSARRAFSPQPEFVKALPKRPIFPKGTVINKCSVVGNGGLLLRSACGKEIDAADYVFRCNLVPIRKFGIDAGYKTNLTTMNPSIMKTRYHEFKTSNSTQTFSRDLLEYRGHLFLPCLINEPVQKFCTTKVLPAIRQAQHSGGVRAKLTVGDPRHLLGILDVWKHAGIRYMSTGFYLAQTALTVCNEVHLFGFWPFNRTVYPIRRTLNYHYFDNMVQGSSHKFSSEFQILWQQHAEGILKIHMQDCEDSYD